MSDKSRKAVPREATDDMIEAGRHAAWEQGDARSAIVELSWRAMFDAAPVLATAPAEPPKDGLRVLRDRVVAAVKAVPPWEDQRQRNPALVHNDCIASVYEAFAAYINEKPAEHRHTEVGYEFGGRGAYASPPHAAAEPEKPAMTDDQIDATLKAAWPRFASFPPNVREREAFRIGARGRWLCARSDAETPCTKTNCNWPQCMASPSAQPIAEHTNRWNVEPTDYGLRVCRGDHQSAEQCEWEYFVPKSAAQPIAREVRNEIVEWWTDHHENSLLFNRLMRLDPTLAAEMTVALKSAGKEST